MLPSLKQRVMIFLAVLIGAWCWLFAERTLLAGNLGPGISLLQSGGGVGRAVLMLIAAGLPAIALGLMVSGAAHPLAGVFTIGLSLAILSTFGGPIDGVLWRAAGPEVYGVLAVETVLWALGLVGVLALVARTRLWVRRRFPRLTTDQHFGTTTKLRPPGFDALTAGLICAAAGGLCSWVLLKSTDSGQVFGALMVGFWLGALIAYQIVSQPNVTAVLMSPLAVALAVYLYTWLQFSSLDAMMKAFNAGQLPALARALPIDYASSAVAGCVLGVTMAQAIEHTRHHAAETA